MKKLVLATMLSLGFLACGKGQSASQPDASPCTEASCPMHLPEAGADLGSVMDTIDEDNFQFSLPGPGWKMVKYPDDVVRVMMVNENLNTIVFLAKEATTESAPDYIINAMRTFRIAGATVSSAKQTTINGNSFIQVNATDNDRHIIALISVKKGFGYIFTCAVEEEADGGMTDRCMDIANTLSIQ